MKRKVRLEGEMATKFGKEFTMNVNSFAEALKCLDGNFPEFRKYLIECHEKNIAFDCQIAGTPVLDERELLLECCEGDIQITPIPAGSGRGIGKLIAGIVMIYIVVQTGGLGAISAAAAGGATAGTYLAATAAILGLSIGVNLAMSGIAEMLAPDPSTDNDQDESYLFQGTGQTLVEGDPVPVLYGKLRVPGRPISLQVRNERLNYYDAGTYYTDSPADTTDPIPTEGPSGPQGPGGPAEGPQRFIFR